MDCYVVQPARLTEAAGVRGERATASTAMCTPSSLKEDDPMSRQRIGAEYPVLAPKCKTWCHISAQRRFVEVVSEPVRADTAAIEAPPSLLRIRICGINIHMDMTVCPPRHPPRHDTMLLLAHCAHPTRIRWELALDIRIELIALYAANLLSTGGWTLQHAVGQKGRTRRTLRNAGLIHFRRRQWLLDSRREHHMYVPLASAIDSVGMKSGHGWGRHM